MKIAPIEQLLDPTLVEQRARAMQAMLAPRLELLADGRALKPEWGPTEILRDRQSVRFHLRYPTASPAGAVALTTVMFPYDPMHQTFINIHEGETLTSQMIVDATHPHIEYFVGTRQGVAAVIKKFI